MDKILNKKTEPKLGVRIKKYIEKGNLYYDLMFLPGLIFLLVFNIIPLFGLSFVFFDYIPALGFAESEFVGFENFELLFSRPDFWPAIRNTFFIAMLKIIFGFPIPIIFALLMNEVRNVSISRAPVN